MSFICKTCGGLAGTHRPSQFDKSGVGHPDHTTSPGFYTPLDLPPGPAPEPMTPNKSDSVCDCIYGDGACKEHSDSGERLVRLVLEAWYPSSLMKDLPLSQMNPGDVKRARNVAAAFTAHIQAVWEEIAQEINTLPVLGGLTKDLIDRKEVIAIVDRYESVGTTGSVIDSVVKDAISDSNWHNVSMNVKFDGTRLILAQVKIERLAQYLGEKQ